MKQWQVSFSWSVFAALLSCIKTSQNIIAFVHAILDSFCPDTKTIPDRAGLSFCLHIRNSDLAQFISFLWYCIMNSLSELGFRINSITTGLLDCLSWIPDFKAQDCGLHSQLYTEVYKVFLYDTFTRVRKGSVKFDFTWRKWVVKLRKWELYASFTPPLRSLKFLFSCGVSARFLKRSEAAPCRSLKWRVTYQIGVHAHLPLP